MALLGLADPEADPAVLPIGAANARLLQLRCRLFGPRLTCIADCPQCGERLELDFSIGDLPLPPLDAPELTGVGAERLRFRLPTWADLAEIARAEGEEDQRSLLLRRCLLEPESGEVSASDVAAMSEAMEAADPLAELLIATGCSRCGVQFVARFDVVEYLWTELDARARRLLGEVHELASAYGWRESEVLALSTVRRQAYLEMVGSK